MGKGLQRFLKLEWGVLPILRRRQSEMPILLSAFRCNVKPPFGGNMLVGLGLTFRIELELQPSLSIAFPISRIQRSPDFEMVFKSIERLVEQ